MLIEPIRKEVVELFMKNIKSALIQLEVEIIKEEMLNADYSNQEKQTSTFPSSEDQV